MKKLTPNNAMVQRSIAFGKRQHLAGTDTTYIGSTPVFEYFDIPQARGVVQSRLIKVAKGVPFVRSERV